MKAERFLERAKSNPASLRFMELCRLAEAFGFRFRRQSGSHRIYAHDGIRELLNFQDDAGMAKAYQVRQLLACVDGYGLTLGGVDYD